MIPGPASEEERELSCVVMKATSQVLTILPFSMASIPGLQ